MYFVSTQLSQHKILNIQHRIARKRQNEIMARIQEAILETPKPPPSHTIKAVEANKFLRKKREAEVSIIYILLMLII